MGSTKLIQLFTVYGLTKNQAKILSILTQNKTYLTVKQITQLSNLAKETIYMVLLKLEETGLIQKAITRPKKYCAIPLKSVLAHLQKQKSNQIHEIAELTTQVLMEHNQNSRISPIVEKSQFILIPKGTHVTSTMTKAILKSKKSIRVNSSWKHTIKALDLYETAIKKALSNGAKIQLLVTDKPKDNKVSKELENCLYNPNILVKTIDSPTEMIWLIFDDQEAVLVTNPKTGFYGTSVLWSNNQSLIKILTSCFDMLWKEL